MNHFSRKTLALAMGLALGSAAMAQTISNDEYQTAQDRISIDYQSARQACTRLAGNANDICKAEAKGNEKVALANLEVAYKPSIATRYKARMAKAGADYAVANERCDDFAGNAKDLCVKEARAAQVAASADARLQRKTSDANATADEQSAAARGTANLKVAAARNDAQTDKLDAQYKVEQEKCETYAGGAKEHCRKEVNVRFGK